VKRFSLYNDRADEFAAAYESLKFEDVHWDVLDVMPQASALVLDIGAGSGTDVAWFAKSGCDVVAVEPSGRMIEQARQLQPEPNIQWIQDKLPRLEKNIQAWTFIHSK
jgi:SAM-dependent methyltransferase